MRMPNAASSGTTRLRQPHLTFCPRDELGAALAGAWFLFRVDVLAPIPGQECARLFALLRSEGLGRLLEFRFHPGPLFGAGRVDEVVLAAEANRHRVAASSSFQSAAIWRARWKRPSTSLASPP